MAEQRVVVGWGPDALRVAAVLAARGDQVQLLQRGSTACGLDHPDLPAGTGRLSVTASQRSAVERVLGPLVEAPAREAAIAIRGQHHRLPLGPVNLGRLLERSARLPVARAYFRTRARNALAEVLGGGQEERTYQDWVVRRMGGPAYHHLYRSYAARRWGAPADELSVNVARLHHGLPAAEEQQVLGGGSAEAITRAEKLILDAGGSIRLNARVEGIDLEKGRIRVLRLEGGEQITLDAPLWCTEDPATVAGWLGDGISAATHNDAMPLRMVTSAQVALRGKVDGLAQVTHILDEAAPFYRVVSPYGLEQAAIFHATAPRLGPDGSTHALVAGFVRAAQELGIGSFEGAGARVEILDSWAPVWRIGEQARMRRLLLAWRGIGLVAAGRAGTYAPLDPSQVVAHAWLMSAEADPDQREIYRMVVEPPVGLDDLSVPPDRFIER